MIPSPFQQKFFDWVETGRGSCVLVAVAGAGKTTSVIGAQRLIQDSAFVQILAFNSAIGKELREKLATTATDLGRDWNRRRAGTFHSLGFNALLKKFNCRFDDLKPDAGKLGKLVRDWLDEDDQELYGSFITKLVGYARGEGIGAIVPDTEDHWYGLVAHHDMYLESEEADEATAIKLARELLRRSNEAAKNRIIDFDDQLYLPLLWKLRLWQNDWVFIDEAQDTSPVRRALAKLALRPGGRLVAVGDPHQAIYGFTGASHDAIELIKKEFNAIELPLSVCYRCGSAIVASAREIVDHILPFEEAPVGIVETICLDDALNHLDAHDAVLCRNTKPLVELAYSLISKGRGCAILGKEIGAGLVNLVRKQKAAGIDRLIEKLTKFREREVAKFTARGEEGKAEAVSDKVDCVMTVIDHLPEDARTVPELVRRIEAMFTDSNGVLLLSTIHKAKGREWKRVAILAPELMPSSWARQEWQQAQEQNLIYVARTRAQEHLMFVPGPKKEAA